MIIRFDEILQCLEIVIDEASIHKIVHEKGYSSYLDKNSYFIGLLISKEQFDKLNTVYPHESLNKQIIFLKRQGKIIFSTTLLNQSDILNYCKNNKNTTISINTDFIEWDYNHFNIKHCKKNDRTVITINESIFNVNS